MTDVQITNKFGQTFTFGDGEVDKITSKVNSNPDTDAMPGSPPGDAIIFDFNGAVKVITVTGALLNSDSSLVTGGTTPTVDTKEKQKRWLEALQDGFQNILDFSSNNDQYTYSGSNTVTEHDNFISGDPTYQTKVVVAEVSFEEIAGSGATHIPFTLKLIAGARTI